MMHKRVPSVSAALLSDQFCPSIGGMQMQCPQPAAYCLSMLFEATAALDAAPAAGHVLSMNTKCGSRQSLLFRFRC